MGSATKLSKLLLHRTRLSGSLPTQLASVSTLASLNVAGARLSGSLPSLADIPKLRECSLLDVTGRVSNQFDCPEAGTQLPPNCLRTFVRCRSADGDAEIWGSTYDANRTSLSAARCRTCTTRCCYRYGSDDDGGLPLSGLGAIGASALAALCMLVCTVRRCTRRKGGWETKAAGRVTCAAHTSSIRRTNSARPIMRSQDRSSSVAWQDNMAPGAGCANFNPSSSPSLNGLCPSGGFRSGSPSGEITQDL